MNHHTPGPWRTVEVPTSIGTCHRIFPLAWGDEPPTHGGICVYDDRTSLNPHADGEQAANARLIAAAPDLLDALETMLRRCDWYGSAIYPDEYGDYPVTGEELRDMAKAAVTKAKGGIP